VLKNLPENLKRIRAIVDECLRRRWSPLVSFASCRPGRGRSPWRGFAPGADVGLRNPVSHRPDSDFDLMKPSPSLPSSDNRNRVAPRLADHWPTASSRLRPDDHPPMRISGHSGNTAARLCRQMHRPTGPVLQRVHWSGQRTTAGRVDRQRPRPRAVPEPGATEAHLDVRHNPVNLDGTFVNWRHQLQHQLSGPNDIRMAASSISPAYGPQVPGLPAGHEPGVAANVNATREELACGLPQGQLSSAPTR
jgi:hypothetical protein